MTEDQRFTSYVLIVIYFIIGIVIMLFKADANSNDGAKVTKKVLLSYICTVLYWIIPVLLQIMKYLLWTLPNKWAQLHDE